MSVSNITHAQRVSEAYKCLTDPNYVDDDEAEGDLSEEEMFSMFNSMFSKPSPYRHACTAV